MNVEPMAKTHSAMLEGDGDYIVEVLTVEPKTSRFGAPKVRMVATYRVVLGAEHQGKTKQAILATFAQKVGEFGNPWQLDPAYQRGAELVVPGARLHLRTAAKVTRSGRAFTQHVWSEVPS